MQHQPNPPQPNSHHLQYTHTNHPGQQILQSSSPHHQNRFSNQPHPQQMLQQPMHNMNLSDVSLPLSNSQHMLGNVISLDNIIKHGYITLFLFCIHASIKCNFQGMESIVRAKCTMSEVIMIKLWVILMHNCVNDPNLLPFPLLNSTKTMPAEVMINYLCHQQWPNKQHREFENGLSQNLYQMLRNIDLY